ncbi:MAG: acyl carrier protein [Candidatus Omnitrophota bacterium]
MKELAMNDNLEKELRALIAEILEIDEIKITSDARFVEELGMDSMMALEILAAAEKKYKIKIAEEHLIKITTLKNITEIVKTLIENK